MIVGQAQLDLARHGRLQALAALVLGARSEIRDLEIFALGAALGASPAERAELARPKADQARDTWHWAAELNADRPLDGRPADCGGPHPRPYCLCLACHAAGVPDLEGA